MTDLETIAKAGKAGIALVRKVFKDPVKQAEDEAKIAEIKLKSDLNRQEMMEEFYEERRATRESKRTLTTKAMPHLNPDATPGDIEPDWIANFFDKHPLISNEQMQELLARILAGEANNPGSISKRTVNLLADFDQKDLQTFLNLLSFVWQIHTVDVPLIYDFDDSVYQDNGINFGRLMHLENIGMIQLKSPTGFQLIRTLPGMIVFYHDSTMQLELKTLSDSFAFNSGHSYFTESGFELMNILKKDIKKIPDFEAYVRNKWEEFGYVIHPF